MDLSDFDGLFRALTGREPYPWQRRLYRRFMAGGAKAVPDALDLPTGLGKTSIMAIWLIARINEARLPRRLIYVVDRRAVVDQATAEAEGLAKALDALIAGEHGELIRERLSLKAPAADSKIRQSGLPISTLRGQYLDNRRWFDDPASAAIVVGTVDMIGSRLLFSGYGVSPGMRPVHAGLIGVDSLVVLDESHLVPPFKALLRGAAAMIGQDGHRLAALSPLKVASLSATGAEREDADVFQLDDEDRGDARTAARLNAPKRLHLQDEVAPARLAATLADLAWGLRTGADGAARRVVVFCNSRKTAQEVEADLAKRVRAKDAYGKDAALTALLVGERRYAEREDLIRSPVFRRFLGGAAASEDDRPAFLVATSAGEVGVDLDADDLVCDLVAWERMVQRFGRVNRRATPGVAQLLVVPVANEKEAEDTIDDPLLKTLLAPFIGEAWSRDEDGALDASPAALMALKETMGSMLAAASTPEPLRPPLTRAMVDAWSLTRLETHPGRPKIEPWLRGWVDREPQTRVIWRRWLPLREGEIGKTADLCTYLQDDAQPHTSEALEAPSWRVAAVLRERAKALLKPSKAVEPKNADLDDADAGDAAPASANNTEAPGSTPQHPRVVVRLGRDGAVEQVYDLKKLDDAKPDGLARDIAFATVVVDVRLGGLDENGLLSGKADRPPRTADHEPWPLAAPNEHQTTTGWKVHVGGRPESSVGDTKGRWALSDFRWTLGEGDDPASLWVELWRGTGRNPGDPAIARNVQILKTHLTETGAEAARIAAGVGLDAAHTAMLIAAAEAHDLGKARKLWQDAMRAPPGDRPYAKTRGGGDGRALNGYRHEFGSLREVQEAPDRYLAAKGVTEQGLRDLALHLITAHHGWCRPMIKPYDPDQRPDLSVPLVQEAALRFARLQAQWGPWGLAWWEALLRAADWAASGALNAQSESKIDSSAEAAHG